MDMWRKRRFVQFLNQLFLFTAIFTSQVGIGAPIPGDADFQKIPLITGLANAVDFEVASDGRILVVNRFGALLVYSPLNQSVVGTTSLAVHTGIEGGLIGVVTDPQFLENKWVYLVYSPTNKNVNRLSRFTLLENQLALTSEKILLEIPVDRMGGNHDGGNLEFDSNGNLLIGTGDDTFHTKYAPLDETNPVLSAEKSSANTQDLRGKILRVHPEEDGTYTIPPGNLFTDINHGRPEIYIMGARNPYKFSVDPLTQWVLWSDIGPDANSSGLDGPSGKDEINLTKQAGNYGWPHFIGPNIAYRNTYLNYFFDPAAPTNDSVWNTGVRVLPPAQPAWLTFGRSSYMSGPVYRHSSNVVVPGKLPAAFDGYFFYWDFNNSKVWYGRYDAAGTLQNSQEWAFLSTKGKGFIDFEIGPDHRLYVLEYGSGCCALDVGNGVLSRVDYVGANQNQLPLAQIHASVRSGSLPLTVNFTSTGSLDPDGSSVTVTWDFDTDGVFDATGPAAGHTYTAKGIFNAQVRVADGDGGVAVANTTIHAGNNIAELVATWPPQGGLFSWDEDVDISVTVNDKEDGSSSGGTIGCGVVDITPALGHLDHVHDLGLVNNCEHTLFLHSDHNINGEDDLYFQFLMHYRDEDLLDSFATRQIFPKKAAAEYFDEQAGIQLVPNTDPESGSRNLVKPTADGSYLLFAGRNLLNIDGVVFRVAASKSGRIELRLDSPSGDLLASVDVAPTGSLNSWVNLETDLTDPEGMHNLYVIFVGDDLSLSLSSIEFTGAGISYPSSTTPPDLVPRIPPAAVSASTFQAAGLEADKAVDQNTTTRWSSRFTDNQWIAQDLGGLYRIRKIVLNWEAAYGATYQLQVSEDGQSWISIHSEASGGPGIKTYLFTSTPPARYVRMLGLTRGTGWGYSLYEFTVHAERVTSDPPVLTTLLLTPPTSTLAVNQVQQFTADGLDQYGQHFHAHTGIPWSSTSGSSITAGGAFSAAVPGLHRVTASLNGVSGHADIDVSGTTSGNLALNKPTVASSQESETYASHLAFDGNQTTRWASQFSDPQWVAVDLGALYNLSGVKLIWERAAARSFAIQVSLDGAEWQTLYSTTTSSGGTLEIPLAGGTARHVRMFGTTRTTRYGYSLFEFEVYGQPAQVNPPVLTTLVIAPAPALVVQQAHTFTVQGRDQFGANYPPGSVTWSSSAGSSISSTGVFVATAQGEHTITVSGGGVSAQIVVKVAALPAVNLALHQPATSSSVQSATYSAEFAVDGSVDTRWSSAFADPQWLAVDLGAQYQVSSVRLNWERAAARVYSLQVSLDGAAWQSVYTNSAGTAGIQEISLPQNITRHIRVLGTARTTRYGYSLLEFEVYGIPVETP